MVRIERVRKECGAKRAVLDLQVSTAAELPEIGSRLSGYVIAAGTMAQVIQSGAFYTLDETGTWYDEDGSAAS